MFAPESLSENDFLGGKLRIRQPIKGFRAGVDSVLLAASIPAAEGQSVLELGCGAGVASLCLARRVPGVRIAGVELQTSYADLARHNAALNDISFEVFQADLSQLPAEIKQLRFDHVLANPPYFDRRAGLPASDPGREVALGEDTPLDRWIEVASRRLAPKGMASFIHRSERLPELLMALHGRLGSIEVQPLQPRVGRDAQLVLVRARKGGRAAFRLHAPILMHEGATHDRDRDSYCPQISAVLRRGADLQFSA